MSVQPKTRQRFGHAVALLFSSLETEKLEFPKQRCHLHSLMADYLEFL